MPATDPRGNTLCTGEVYQSMAGIFSTYGPSLQAQPACWCVGRWLAGWLAEEACWCAGKTKDVQQQAARAYVGG